MSDRVEAGPPVRLGHRPVGPPVRTGWDAPGVPRGPVTRLDDLTDVESPTPAPVAAPAVLVRGPDGVYRPQPVEVVVAEHQRGDVTHFVAAIATDPPPGVRIGEHVVVLAGPAAGTVYRVEE